jgi:plastocyanin
MSKAVVLRSAGMLALLGAMVGCGSGSTATTHASLRPDPVLARPSPAVTVAIRNFVFPRAVIRVAPGTRVTFINEDDAAHSATATSPQFDTGTLNQGQSRTITFRRAGVYRYICLYHPFMLGKLIVT